MNDLDKLKELDELKKALANLSAIVVKMAFEIDFISRELGISPFWNTELEAEDEKPKYN